MLAHHNGLDTLMDAKTVGRMAASNDIPYNDEAAVSQAGFTPQAFGKILSQAELAHAKFTAVALCDEAGLHVTSRAEWADKWIRSSGSIPQAVLDKLGSNSFSKRKPSAPATFFAYVEKRYEQQACLHFRLGCGPVKNVQLCGAEQQPDLAEYLLFIQLAKLMEAVASIYPYGIRVQIIPDDRRGGTANCWPASYGKSYIAGLQRMVAELGFGAWITIEDGQSKLYAHYNIGHYMDAAEQEILAHPDFQRHLALACVKAKQNFVTRHDADFTEDAIRDSALRYLISHRAESLSGVWTPGDVFPVRYANHPEHYQLYTMAAGITKLPWQIRLPLELRSDSVLQNRMSFYNA